MVQIIFNTVWKLKCNISDMDCVITGIETLYDPNNGCVNILSMNDLILFVIYRCHAIDGIS